MQIDVMLNANTQATMTSDVIVLPEQELKLKFNSEVYRLGTLVLSIKGSRGEQQKKLVAPFVVDITDELIPQILEMEISHVSKGVTLQSWKIPNLTVKKVNHTFEVTPEIAELRANDKTQREAIKEIFQILQKNNIF